MPERKPEDKKRIDKLAIIKSDKYCNARVPPGKYCKHPAGFKTSHSGEGRCFLHGGAIENLDKIKDGIYSKKFKSTLKDEYKRIVEDPYFIDLYSELALVKTILAKFVENISDQLESNDPTLFIETGIQGTKVSSKAKLLMDMLDSIGKISTRIIDAEAKSKQTLTIKQVHFIIQQIKNAMSPCGECPIRKGVLRKLTNIRSPEVEL